MSSQLATHAEIVKIAHLLQLDPTEVEYLASCDADTLIELRGQIVEIFYGDENSNLKRFAKIGNLLPSAVIASLTREAVGPVLASRVAGFVDPKQAANVVSKLPVDFVVDIAVAIDPRRVAPVVGRLDNAFVEQLALELIRRKEYVVMGQFIGFASEETLHAAFNFASDEALLRTAFVAEDKDRISAALAPQTDERIASIIKTAIGKDLWPEAMDLFSQLSDEQYVRVINIASRLSPTVLDKMIAVTTQNDVWQTLIPAISQMEEPDRAAEALLRASADDIRLFSDTAIEDGAWVDIEELLSKLSDERVAEVIKTMLKHDLWYEALEIVGNLGEEQHTRTVNLASKFSPGVLDKMVAATSRHNVWPQMIQTIARMDDPNRACEALLRADNAEVKAFAGAVIAGSAWGEAEMILAKLSQKNRDELIKRLSRLKLAEGFVQSLPVIAA